MGVKAFSIDTSVLNTIQVIKRIVVSNTNSTSSDNILVDINKDNNGTVYIKNKLGIGTTGPVNALDVSGNISANQYCDNNGICSTINTLL
ncbi:MAG: hypothetical protein GXP45_06640 [bacterium]|nr:hypothetical protein [bacterium]